MRDRQPIAIRGAFPVGGRRFYGLDGVGGVIDGMSILLTR
jgi:hypothetical protein